MHSAIILETSKTLRDYRVRTLIDIFRSQSPREGTQTVKNKLKEILQVGVAKAKAKAKYGTAEVLSLKHLKSFRGHRKLRVFDHKGCVCAKCGSEGILLVKREKYDSIGWCVVTKDMVEMNVDHIIPKSKGGKNGLYNLQPMCLPCNTTKRNKVSGLKKVSHSGVKVGERVYIKKFGKILHVGNVIHIDRDRVRTNCSKKDPSYSLWYNTKELYKVYSSN
jgi:hypothetical protein